MKKIAIVFMMLFSFSFISACGESGHGSEVEVTSGITGNVIGGLGSFGAFGWIIGLLLVVILVLLIIWLAKRIWN